MVLSISVWICGGSDQIMASICIGSKVSGMKKMLFCITIDDFLAAISKMPYRKLRTLC